ncbi:transposase [Frankia sp. CcWB3]
MPRGGRPGAGPRRGIVGAFRYVACNGIVWRALPAGFPAWRAVCGFFDRWKDKGVTARVQGASRGGVRPAGVMDHPEGHRRDRPGEPRPENLRGPGPAGTRGGRTHPRLAHRSPAACPRLPRLWTSSRHLRIVHPHRSSAGR